MVGSDRRRWAATGATAGEGGGRAAAGRGDGRTGRWLERVGNDRRRWATTEEGGSRAAADDEVAAGWIEEEERAGAGGRLGKFRSGFGKNFLSPRVNFAELTLRRVPNSAKVYLFNKLLTYLNPNLTIHIFY